MSTRTARRGQPEGDALPRELGGQLAERVERLHVGIVLVGRPHITLGG